MLVLVRAATLYTSRFDQKKTNLVGAYTPAPAEEALEKSNEIN